MLIVETVLWRRLQAQPLNAADRYKGMREVFSRTFQAEGIRGFYKGLLPNMLKVVPSASITYLVYEEMKTRLSLKWRFTWANRPFNTSIMWLLHLHSSIQEMADVNCCISMTANHWYVLRCAKEEPDIALGGMWVRTPTASCAFRLNEFYLELCSCTVIGSLDDIMVVSPVTSSHKYPRLEFLVKGMLRYVAWWILGGSWLGVMGGFRACTYLVPQIPNPQIHTSWHLRSVEWFLATLMKFEML